ncbi:MAG TPA: HAMP domain-containing sensor histidine kinase [Marmoricola sp.]|nr:HAMP domain-containing sensor histidine kinase [Marmoricola sp.]
MRSPDTSPPAQAAATAPWERGPGRQRLLLPWIALSGACLWWMTLTPGGEVVPFHLIWIGFALAYGFEPWPLRRTVVMLAAAGTASGVVLLARARSSDIAWDETLEIPLMLVLSGLVVWHVQRREAALHWIRLLAHRRAAQAARRERLGRLTAHEMRTPLTIATGYIALVETHDTEEERHADLAVVKDELARLGRASDRLLRMIQLDEYLPRSSVDADELLQETAQRWSSVAARHWIVDSDAGRIHASPERARACLDTLIENALRYTGVEDTIRLFATVRDHAVWIGVADSGPGLPEQLALRVNTAVGGSPLVTGDRSPDPLSQTGLGIGLVQEIVAARDGRLAAGRSREGGALFVFCLPQVRPD